MSDADIISPSVTAAQWLSDPANALKATTDFIAALPQDHHIIAWATLGTIGLGALMVLKEAAVFLPGGGPIVSKVANLAFLALSHRDQRKADAAAYTIADTASAVGPLVQAVKGDSRFAHLITPEVESFIAALAQKKA